MINRISLAAAGFPGDGDGSYGDFVVVSGAFGCVSVTPETARAIEAALDAVPAPEWVAFVDRAGSRVRVRAVEVRALCESTAAQRAADRRFDRARRLEERADRRSWEEELD